MPVEWEATAKALEALIRKAATTGARIERDGAKLVQAAMMLHAPDDTGALRSGITVGRYQGHVAVGPTGPYARRIAIGYHGVDALRRHYSEAGHPFARRADEDSAELVHELASRYWRSALGA